MDINFTKTDINLNELLPIEEQAAKRAIERLRKKKLKSMKPKIFKAYMIKFDDVQYTIKITPNITLLPTEDPYFRTNDPFFNDNGDVLYHYYTGKQKSETCEICHPHIPLRDIWGEKEIQEHIENKRYIPDEIFIITEAFKKPLICKLLRAYLSITIRPIDKQIKDLSDKKVLLQNMFSTKNIDTMFQDAKSKEE